MMTAAVASCRRKTREPYTARDFRTCCGEATAKLGSGAITRLLVAAPAAAAPNARPRKARRP
eukprot:scaffold128731_cov42-Phaeocystis_antarctica.AAC.1